MTTTTNTNSFKANKFTSGDISINRVVLTFLDGDILHAESLFENNKTGDNFLRTTMQPSASIDIMGSDFGGNEDEDYVQAQLIDTYYKSLKCSLGIFYRNLQAAGQIALIPEVGPDGFTGAVIVLKGKY